ncbi:MAG: hypothetical protein QME96_13290 [Myxococcota bacterium]|nr:hypothetical protein [Myxococcota bacterium]
MAGKKRLPTGDRVAEPGPAYSTVHETRAEDLVRAIEADPVLRSRLAALLGIPAGLPEALQRLADELREQRLASERRFEAMDRRFEAMDRRFEELRADMDRRFEAMDRRFEEVNARMDKRFEESRAESDKRFEESRANSDKQFEESRANSDKRFAAVIGEMRAIRKAMQDDIRRIGGRWGREAEAAFRKGLIDLGRRYFGGEVRHVTGEDDGTVFPGTTGRQVEIDVVVSNGDVSVVEVKFHVGVGDLLLLANKGRWYEKQYGKTPRLQVVTPDIDVRAMEYAREMGIDVSTIDPVDVSTSE